MKVINATITVYVIEDKKSKMYNALPILQFAKKCNRTRNHICKLINENRLDMVYLFKGSEKNSPRYILMNSKANKEMENFKLIDERKKIKL